MTVTPVAPPPPPAPAGRTGGSTTPNDRFAELVRAELQRADDRSGGTRDRAPTVAGERREVAGSASAPTDGGAAGSVGSAGAGASDPAVAQAPEGCACGTPPAAGLPGASQAGLLVTVPVQDTHGDPAGNAASEVSSGTAPSASAPDGAAPVTGAVPPGGVATSGGRADGGTPTGPSGPVAEATVGSVDAALRGSPPGAGAAGRGPEAGQDAAVTSTVDPGAGPLVAGFAGGTDGAPVAGQATTGAGGISATGSVQGEPTGPQAGAASRGSAVTDQVFGHVTRLVSRGDGVHRLTLRLHPADLGEVKVVLTVRNNVVDVVLAAGADARRALVEGSTQLRSLLELTGASSGQVVIRELAPSHGTSSNTSLDGGNGGSQTGQLADLTGQGTEAGAERDAQGDDGRDSSTTATREGRAGLRVEDLSPRAGRSGPLTDSRLDLDL